MISAVLDAIALQIEGSPLTEAERMEVQRRAIGLGLSQDDATLQRIIFEVRMGSLLREIRTKQDAALFTLEHLKDRRSGRYLPRRWWGKLLLAILAGFLLVQAGMMIKHRELVAERARMAWLDTPSGKAAWRLHQAGLAEALAECAFPEWRIIGGACYPGVTPQNGWRGYTLPPP